LQIHSLPYVLYNKDACRRLVPDVRWSDISWTCISASEMTVPMPVATWSKAWICGHLLAGIVGSSPAGVWKSVSCESCVLSGGVLCVGLITSAEETYRVWCVSVW
jgi:hypothetical protein